MLEGTLFPRNYAQPGPDVSQVVLRRSFALRVATKIAWGKGIARLVQRDIIALKALSTIRSAPVDTIAPWVLCMQLNSLVHRVLSVILPVSLPSKNARLALRDPTAQRRGCRVCILFPVYFLRLYSRHLRLEQRPRAFVALASFVWGGLRCRHRQRGSI